MTKADLVDHVTALGDLTRRDGEVIVETLFDSIIDALKTNDKGRGARVREFSFTAAQAAYGAQSEDRGIGRGASQASAVLQAKQRASGPGESR